ncbi:hypothetical protein MB27_04835 [Actinoplanes utahensis]|uniref:Uncharacterized protein n=1 Tax=Actinoplanes utahensis TaxID=1869 RepID=A0A0A6USY2_ACTUT|nr:hypothetical protein MB27_04835 [Actinoplanes utahensis]
MAGTSTHLPLLTLTRLNCPVAPAAASRNCCQAAPAVQPHCWSGALSAALPAVTSRHMPLLTTDRL